MAARRRLPWIVLALPAGLIALCRALETERGAPGPSPSLERAGSPAPEPVTPAAPAAVETDAGARSSDAARAERAPLAPAPSAEVPLFHGEIVDAATGEPVPDVLVVAGSIDGFSDLGELLQAPTDRAGRFAADRPLDAGVEHVSVLNPVHRTHIRTVPRESWIALEEPGGWRVPIAIAPTYRLRIHGADEVPLEAWTARLVATVGPQDEDGSAWVRLNPGDPPYLRYDNPVTEHDEAGRTFVEVQDLRGRFGGSVEVDSVVGVYPVVLEIRVAGRAQVEGRTVDAAGEGVEGTRIFVIPVERSPRGLLEKCQATSDADGRYRLAGLVPGRYWFSAYPELGDALTLVLNVPPGESRAPDLVLPDVAIAGAIVGRVENRSGGPVGGTTAVLRSPDGALRVDHVSSFRFPMGGPAREPTFYFDDLPPGEYELSVITDKGFEVAPGRLRVSPPTDGLVFTVEDEAALDELAFRFVDAATGAELADLAVFVFIDTEADLGRDWETVSGEPFEMVAGARFRWSASARGFRPVRGDERAFAPSAAGGPAVATVELEPGFHARLVLRDCEGRLGPLFDSDAEASEAERRPPVAGAEVFADGKLAGTSGPDGVVDLVLAREPERIEIRLDGWSTLGSLQLRDGRIGRLGSRPEVLVWMIGE